MNECASHPLIPSGKRLLMKEKLLRSRRQGSSVQASLPLVRAQVDRRARSRLTLHQKPIPGGSIRVRQKKLSPSSCRPPRRSKCQADKVRPADSAAALDTRNRPMRDTCQLLRPKEFAAAVNQKGSTAARKRVRKSFWRSTNPTN